MSDSNGHGGARRGPVLTTTRLISLLSHHERIVEAIRLVLTLLNDERVTTKERSATGVMAKALALDEARRNGAPRPNPHQPGYNAPVLVRARRKESAAVLDGMSRTTPTTTLGKYAGVLLRAGYIKRKGDGYVRTKKPFSLEPKFLKTRSHEHVRRQQTAAALARMSATDPTPANKIGTRGIGILVQHGYIARKEDGYVLTGKEYVP